MNMNLLGLAQQFLGGSLGGNGANGQGSANVLIGLVMSLIQSQPGGLMGLIQQFEGAGLTQQVQSWVSTGQNQPVNPAQVQQAINPAQMTQLAQQSGMAHGDIASVLSTLLPQVVDHLTPNGNVPHDTAVADSLAALKNMLSGLNTTAAPQSVAS